MKNPQSGKEHAINTLMERSGTWVETFYPHVHADDLDHYEAMVKIIYETVGLPNPLEYNDGY